MTKSISKAMDANARARGIGILAFDDKKPAAAIGGVSPPGPPPSTSYSDLILSYNPNLYMRLGSASGIVAVDEISANNGVFVGTPILGESGAIIGDSNTAVLFDNNVPQYVGNIGALPDFSFIQNTITFTVECWAKFQTITTSHQAMIANTNSSSAGTKGIYFALSITDEFAVDITRGVSGSRPLLIRSQPNIITDTTNFHHFVITGDGVNGYMYIDGVLVQIEPVGPPSVGDSTDLLHLAIGVNANVPQFGADVVLDEVAIYTQKLTSSEVLDNYRKGINVPFVASNYFNAVMNESPMYYARMDDSTVPLICGDIIGGKRGLYQNTPTLGETGAIANDTNTSVTFNNASSEYVSDIGVVSDFSFIQNTGVFSVELWVKFQTFAGVQNIIGNATALTEKGMEILYIGNSNVLRFALLNGSGIQVIVDTPANPLVLAQFHHVVAVGNGVTAYIYIDGVQVASTVLGALQTGDSSFPVNIAAINATGFASATIDEVAIYSSELTQQNITDHYNAGI